MTAKFDILILKGVSVLRRYSSISLLLFLSLALTRSVSGQNLLVNGDFHAGSSGFVTDYNHSTDCTVAGNYIVGNNPKAYHPNGASYGDHTSGKGLMLIVNGADKADKIVWQQSVKVQPNTQYMFSYWAASWGNNDGKEPSPARLLVTINGVQVGTEFLLSAQDGRWNQFEAMWSSGPHKTATICIVDQNTETIGNDFSLDDIVFALVQGPLVITPPFLTGGAYGTVTLRLATPAANKIVFSLASSDASTIRLPRTCVISSGQTTGAFVIHASRPLRDKVITLTATSPSHSLTGTLCATPTKITAIDAYVQRVKGREVWTGKVILSREAPREGYSIALASSDITQAVVPVEVQASSGAKSVTFPIIIGHPNPRRKVTLTAAFGGLYRSKSLVLRSHRTGRSQQ